ncbi:hypothetical protein ACJJIQ_01090 [Microbulbifer sp. ANSA003]|uniref:hypothetical protein n=1 Tax=Microbulbifer sp. ANSA003 TaxID=3243360 RepID=UPI00404282A8
MRLFSELGGFIIFSPEQLEEFCQQRDIKNDIMSFLTSDESADIITVKGIATPILNLEPDDYKIEVVIDCETNFINQKASKGWVFSSNGKLCICGAGYFFDYNYNQLVNEGKIFERQINEGWHSMSVTLPESDLLRIHLNSEKILPKCFGDYHFDFYN